MLRVKEIRKKAQLKTFYEGNNQSDRKKVIHKCSVIILRVLQQNQLFSRVRRQVSLIWITLWWYARLKMKMFFVMSFAKSWVTIERIRMSYWLFMSLSCLDIGLESKFKDGSKAASFVASKSNSFRMVSWNFYRGLTLGIPTSRTRCTHITQLWIEPSQRSKEVSATGDLERGLMLYAR